MTRSLSLSPGVKPLAAYNREPRPTNRGGFFGSAPLASQQIIAPHRDHPRAVVPFHVAGSYEDHLISTVWISPAETRDTPTRRRLDRHSSRLYRTTDYATVLLRARMKSFVVAPFRFPGQQTFAHQRSVIFWSQHRFRCGYLHVKVNYLNYDIACNIISRCQLLMFSILTWQLRHCGVTEVLPASFCWLL
jgi:hypothetical protein